jgi:hypothetical protein
MLGYYVNGFPPHIAVIGKFILNKHVVVERSSSALIDKRGFAFLRFNVSNLALYPRIPQSPHRSLLATRPPFSILLFFPTSDMSEQSGPSHFQVLFEAAFRDYEKQTGKTLANHPLAEKLQGCHSVESVTAVLLEQTESSSEIRGKDKVLKPLKNVLSVLHKLSSASSVNLVHHLGLVRP